MKKYTQEPNQPKPNHEQNQKLNRLNYDATGKSPLYIKADLNKSDYFTSSLSVLKNCFNATMNTIAKAIMLRISFDSIISFEYHTYLHHSQTARMRSLP